MLVHEFKQNRIIKNPLEYNVIDSDEEDKRNHVVKMSKHKKHKSELYEKCKEIEIQFKDNLEKYAKHKKEE